MKIFGLDTTRKQANIFAFDSAKKLEDYFDTMSKEEKHSESLFNYIEKAVDKLNEKISDFDYLACVVGPGSFTGIRIGMATIKGLNAVYNKIIVPINMFEVMLPQIKDGIIAICSTSTSVYFCKVNDGEIVESGVVLKSELKDLLDKKDLLILESEQNDIGFEYNKSKLIKNEDLILLYKNAIIKKIDSGDFKNFEPYYLQLSQAERNLLDGKN